MTFAEYSIKAHESANHAIDPTEILVGLTSEHGEVLEEIKRMIRNGGILTNQVKDGIKMECGDCLWYISEAAKFTGQTLETLMPFAKSSARIYHCWPNISPLLAALKMVSSSGSIAEMLADTIILERPISGQPIDGLSTHLINSLSWMLVLLDLIQMPITQVMEYNIEKLRLRRLAIAA